MKTRWTSCLGSAVFRDKATLLEDVTGPALLVIALRYAFLRNRRNFEYFRVFVSDLKQWDIAEVGSRPLAFHFVAVQQKRPCPVATDG